MVKNNQKEVKNMNKLKQTRRPTAKLMRRIRRQIKAKVTAPTPTTQRRITPSSQQVRRRIEVGRRVIIDLRRRIAERKKAEKVLNEQKKKKLKEIKRMLRSIRRPRR